MSTVAQSLARSFEFISHMMVNNQQRHFPPSFLNYQNNLGFPSPNQPAQPLYSNNIESPFGEFEHGGNRNVNYENNESDSAGKTYQQL